MKLANRTEYRLMRALGLWNPFYHLRDYHIVVAQQQVVRQHPDHSAQEAKARAIARLLWAKRHQNRWRRWVIILGILAGVFYYFAS